MVVSGLKTAEDHTNKLSLLVHWLNKALGSNVKPVKPGCFRLIRLFHYQRFLGERGYSYQKKKKVAYLISRHHFKIKKKRTWSKLIFRQMIKISKCSWMANQSSEETHTALGKGLKSLWCLHWPPCYTEEEFGQSFLLVDNLSQKSSLCSWFLAPPPSLIQDFSGPVSILNILDQHL